MSQPEAKPNEPSRMKKILNAGTDESPLAKLKRTVGTDAQLKNDGASGVESSRPVEALKPTPVVSRSNGRAGGLKFAAPQWKFLPAFWTIASVMSFTVNIVLLIVAAVLLQNLKTVGVTATGISDQLLGGLYNNFVKMDAASIKTNIHVEKDIPVQFTLNVSGATNVTLSQDVRITGAFVTLRSFGSKVINDPASIILPAGTVLPIYIENLVVPVDQKVPAILDVPVDIPLNATELHQPFTGLQDVVKPYYCLIKPGALNLTDNSPVCP
jgi:hypothetical protein